MKVVFTFGRFNPPTIGHEKLIKKVEKVAGSGADFLIYPSWSQSPDKDPMPHEVKVKYMKLAFRKYSDKIISDPKCKTAIHVVTKLFDAGYTDVTMVVGGDRVSDFNKLINKYNGVKAKHGFYEFANGVKVVSAGERDPDATGVEGMSASKMRNAAVDGDFESFKTGIPAVMLDKMKKQMFDDLRKHMKVSVSERVLSPTEEKKKEEIILSMKKKVAEFKKKYGAKWKEVMYATATKMAKNEGYMTFNEYRKS